MSRSGLGLGCVIGYCYLCDRTDFFRKQEKHYEPVQFALQLLLIPVVGFAAQKIRHR